MSTGPADGHPKRLCRPCRRQNGDDERSHGNTNDRHGSSVAGADGTGIRR